MARRGSVGTGPMPRGKRIALDIRIDPSPLIMEQSFKGYARDIKSFKVPLERSIRKVAQPSFARNFEVGGRPPWPPLAPYTVERRGSARPILVRSGTLKQVSQQMNIWTIQGQQGRAFVSNIPERAWYGVIHQNGLVGARTSMIDNPTDFEKSVWGSVKGTRGDIPQRIFMALYPEDTAAIQEIFGEWADERARANNVTAG